MTVKTEAPGQRAPQCDVGPNPGTDKNHGTTRIEIEFCIFIEAHLEYIPNQSSVRARGGRGAGGGGDITLYHPFTHQPLVKGHISHLKFFCPIHFTLPPVPLVT